MGGRMKNKSLVASVIIALFLTGCASIVGQSVFPVIINSNPSGANVKVTDEKGMDIFNGITPTTVTLSAGESYFHAKTYNLTFSKEGYAEQHAQVKAEISGWYFGNILFGGLIGMLIVDPITGKMWKLPTQAYSNLSAISGDSAKNKNHELQIATLDQIPKEMRKDLIQLN